MYDKNLYAYCDNNPVMRIDSDGKIWIPALAAGAAVGALSQYVSNVIGGILDGETFSNVLIPTKGEWAEIAGAALSGALTTTSITSGGLAMTNAAINSVSYIAKCTLDNEKFNTTQFVSSIGRAFVSDAIGDGGINAKKLRGVWKTANKKINATKSVTKKAMYSAKKTTIKRNVGKNVGGSFFSATFFNNVGKFFKRLFR